MEEQNINNPSMGVDTSLWGTSFTSPTPVDTLPTPQYYDVAPLPKIDNSNLIGAIRFDASNRMMGLGQKSGREDLLKALNPNAGKIDLTTTVDIRDTHQKLSNGTTWIPKYKSYMPGVDNDARLSAQQSSSEKFFNPIKRFMENTSLGAHDLLANVYGLGAAALSGRFDAIYDNDYSKYIDDLTERNNFEFKNYYNEAERNQNLGLNLQTWDKVLGGAEFTARMLASEAILAVATDGMSLPSTMAKWGLKVGNKVDDMSAILRTGSNIAKMSKTAIIPEMRAASNVANSGSRMLHQLELASQRGKIGEGLVKARFALTSPMYEAGFEARHFQKEAEQQFWDYYRNKGIEPTNEEIDAFGKKLAGASNGVFMTNMAILAPSNLAMFGDFLNMKNPLSRAVFSPGEWVTKNIFKIGTEVGEKGAYQAMKADFANKAAAYITPVIKGALVEGLYEEGSQGIASNTYKNYVASSYDKEAMKNTVGYLDSFSKAFTDQFNTKEGFEEIAIGALIGGLFGGVGGAINTNRQYKNQKNIAEIQNQGKEFIDAFKSNVYTNEQLLSLFSNGNRFQDIRDQLDKLGESGDNLKKASLQAQSFISLLDAYNSVGKGEEFVDMFKNVLGGIDTKYISDTTGLSLEQAEEFKNSQIQEMLDISKNYTTALEAGRYLFGKNVSGNIEIETPNGKKQINGQSLANALAFSTAMAGFNQKFAADSFDAFITRLAQVETNKDTIEKFGSIGAIRSADKNRIQEIDAIQTELNNLILEQGRLTQQINLASNQQTENTKKSAERRIELANELQSLQDRITALNNKKDILWRSTVDNFYSKMGKTGYAPEIDLRQYDKIVKELYNSIDKAGYSVQDTTLLKIY